MAANKGSVPVLPIVGPSFEQVEFVDVLPSNEEEEEADPLPENGLEWFSVDEVEDVLEVSPG